MLTNGSYSRKRFQKVWSQGASKLKFMITSPLKQPQQTSTGCVVSCTSPTPYAQFNNSRDYPDEEAQKILENLRHALLKNPKSKILVNELIIPSFITPANNPTVPASECLPSSQSGYPETCHMMQLNTMALMGGKERTYHDIVKIGHAAGLKVSKFHQLRMFTGTIEFELA